MKLFGGEMGQFLGEALYFKPCDNGGLSSAGEAPPLMKPCSNNIFFFSRQIWIKYSMLLIVIQLLRVYIHKKLAKLNTNAVYQSAITNTHHQLVLLHLWEHLPDS